MKKAMLKKWDKESFEAWDKAQLKNYLLLNNLPFELQNKILAQTDFFIELHSRHPN